MQITNFDIATLREVAHKGSLKDGDYRDAEGFLCCGKCHTRKEDRIEEIGGALCAIKCKCEEERERAAVNKEKREEIERRRKEAFSSEKTRRFSYTFANDDGGSPTATEALKRYCDNFPEHKKAGEGLLLYSKYNGSGKTFLACAVANALIDKGYRVKVTSFRDIKDELTAPNANRKEILRSLRAYDLIVLDDLGAEYNTPFVKEVEYIVIDDLTENFVPMILTTNLIPSDMNKTNDLDLKRIYDRVLGQSGIVKVETADNISRRVKKCNELTEKVRANHN